MESGNYFWCHYDKFWFPLQNMVYQKILKRDKPTSLAIHSTNIETIIEMRKIINHFLLAYFDISEPKSSMASSEVTNSWKRTKLIKRKPW
jgi:hypothetical protein